MGCKKTSDRKRAPEEASPDDIEKETRRLMEKAMATATAPLESATPSEEEQKPVRATATSKALEETFQRISVRMEDLLSTIEDSLRALEPSIEQQVSKAVEELSKQLKDAGLGLFYTKAVKISREVLKSSLSPKKVLSSVYDTIAEIRDEIDDIISKTTRGSVRHIAQATSRLQSKLIQLYATLQEREHKIEVAYAELFKLKKRVQELELEIQSKDKRIAELEENISKLTENLQQLQQELKERNELITSLKGELAQATSQIEQQQKMIEKLGSAEEIVADYEEKLQRISELEGTVAELQEQISQKDSTIEYLRDEVTKTSDYVMELEKKATELSNSLAKTESENRSLREENEKLQAKIAELSARWDTLYQVAEEEPDFKAYFLIADKTKGVPISHLASALGIPVVQIKRQLQRFIDVGLVEIDGDVVRPRNLSELAQELAGQEAQMIEEAKSELGEDGMVILEAFDADDSLSDKTNEYQSKK